MKSIFHLEGENKTVSKSKPIQKSGNNLHAGSTLYSFCSQGIEPRLLERLRKGLESEKTPNFLIA